MYRRGKASAHVAVCTLRLALFLIISAMALSACAPDVVRHNETGNDRFDESAYDDAVSEYRLAQVDEPDLAEPYYNAANAYNRMSQVDAALAQTDQALKTADPELAAQSWYNLGNAFFDAEQWPQAIEAYKEALRFQSDDLDAKHNLELALQKLEEQQQQQDEQEQEQDEQSDDEQQEQQEQDQQDEQQQEQEPESSESQEEQQETSEPSGEPQEGTEGMTEEQAIQLLQALLDESQTLQERLQEIHQAPGSVPEQDW